MAARGWGGGQGATAGRYKVSIWGDGDAPEPGRVVVQHWERTEGRRQVAEVVNFMLWEHYRSF